MYEDILKKLKKEELVGMVDYFHKFCEVYNYPIADEIKKYKKEEIVSYLVDKEAVYLKFIIQSLNNEDYELLKKIDKKNRTINNQKLKDYLISCRIIVNDTMADDVYENIKNILKSKKVKKNILKNTKLYNLGTGIIVAYGVIDYEKFKKIIGNEENLKLLELYNHCNYKIVDNKVVASELNNKTKINKYYKANILKDFKYQEFRTLGNQTYHHQFKTYQKLVHILKKNYVFQKSDISFLDNVIIIPYLYNNTKMEEDAKKTLNKNIDRYFEFANDKLKQKLITKICQLKKDFPIWEYRGRSIKEETSK